MYRGMACMVMACIAMPDISMAYIAMTCIVMAVRQVELVPGQTAIGDILVIATC